MTWLKADVTVNSGYLVGSAIFLSVLIVLVAVQIAANGTTMADFADRSLGIGYTGGSILLLTCLMLVLALWYWSEGTISVNTVSTPRVEVFYWAAITFSQTELPSATGSPTAAASGMKGGVGVRCRLSSCCCDLLLDGRDADAAVLGGVHSHATTRGNLR